MQKEIRTVCYDDDLHLEAYRFEGIVQPFPNHFHDYYVIGFIESGTRCLSCKNKEYTIGQGNILLFNPNDNHSCVQCDGGTLDYRGLNIPKETMLSLAEEITGQRVSFGFSENVIKNDELNFYLRSLHQMIMDSSKEFEKEEMLLLFISLLIKRYRRSFSSCITKKIGGYGYNTVQTTRRIFTYGILFMLPFLFIFDFSPDFQKIIKPEYALNLIYLGSGASALCFVAWNYAVKALGAVKTSAYIYAVPVITVVTSVIVLNEEITWLAAAGIGLTLIGLFLSERKIQFKKRGK